MAETAGGIDDFTHEITDEGGERRTGKEMFRVQAAGDDGEAVERDVPDELFPAREGEAGLDAAWDVAGAEGVRNGEGAFTRAVEMLAKGDEALGAVIDHSGGEAVDADETQAAEDPLGAEMTGEELFIAEAVLQGEEQGVAVQQRRQQAQEFHVGGGFEGDDDEITGAYGVRMAMALDRGQ